jgi:hypothetical protein
MTSVKVSDIAASSMQKLDTGATARSGRGGVRPSDRLAIHSPVRPAALIGAAHFSISAGTNLAR